VNCKWLIGGRGRKIRLGRGQGKEDKIGQGAGGREREDKIGQGSGIRDQGKKERMGDYVK
jgi:hypothetical protein